MAAYLIYKARVTDPGRYQEYMARTPAAVAAFGGRFLTRAGTTVAVEGPPETRRIIICEFPDLARALAFCSSDEYAAVKCLREHAAEVEMVVVDGLPAPAAVD